jgi:hypothetical protein
MKVLIIVDMQNDFIDGALGTPEAQAIVPNVISKIEDAAGNAVAEATGLEISLDENEKDFTYDAATATLTWKGTPTGTVYTHDVNLNITYTHNWGVVTKTFKVTVTRKVQ